MSFFYVALGGFFGSILRYYIYVKINGSVCGTWIANISGSVLLALIFRFYFTEQISESLWLVIGVGFCGSYTTFSTFGNESLQFILKKRYMDAFAYITSTVIISIFSVIVLLSF